MASTNGPPPRISPTAAKGNVNALIFLRIYNYRLIIHLPFSIFELFIMVINLLKFCDLGVILFIYHNLNAYTCI